jgi:hypothetical protein
VVIAATVCGAWPAVALTATSPGINSLGSTNVYDTTAEIDTQIDPGGADTTWQLNYGSGGQLNQHIAGPTVPAAGGAQNFSVQLSGLQPSTTYDFQVVATNSQGSNQSAAEFGTVPQFTGTAGSPTDFSTTTVRPCPGGPISVNWGDGTTTASVPMTCNGDTNSGTLDTTHTYATAGHYDVSTGPADDLTPIAGAQIAAATTTTTTTTTTTAPPPPPPPPSTDVDSLFGTVALATPSMATTDPPTATPDAKAQVRVILRTAKGTTTRSTVTDSHGDYDFSGLPSCIPSDGATGAVTCTVEVLGARGVIDDEKSVTLPARVSNTQADLVAGRLSERDWVSGVVLAPSDAAGAGGAGSPPGWDLSTVGPSIRAAAGLGPVPHAASGAAGGLPTTDITVSQVDGPGKSKQIYDALKSCQQDHWGEVAPGLGVPSHKTDCTSTVGPFLLEGVPLTPPKGEVPHFVITLLERNAAGKYVAVDSAPLKLPSGPQAKDGDRPLISAPALNSVVPVPDQPGGRTISGQITQLRPFLPRASAVDPPPVANAEVKLTVGAPGLSPSSTATTRTDSHGYYAFSNAPGCGGRGQCRYTVAVVTGRTVEDSETFPPPGTTPSVTVANLTGNLTSGGLFVRGSVAAPDGSGPLPATELTIGPRGKDGTTIAPIFDSRTDCAPKDWGPPSGGPSGRPCDSTVGSYLLGGVDRTGNGRPDASAKAMVITLLERNSAGKFVAIDSAPITLPTQSGTIPVINAPALTAVVPVPTTTNGRTVSGTVTTFKPFMPGGLGGASSQPADAGAQVTVTIKAHSKGVSDNVSRTLKTDAKGRYSVTGLPACNPKGGATAGDTCTVSVGSSKSSLDVEEFTLSELSPTTAEVDLQAGLEANSPVLTGTVKAPPAPGKAGLPHTDIQISTGKGQVLYDALQACAKGDWSQAHPGPCVGGFGDYALGSIPVQNTLSIGQVTVTLLETNAAGRFTPVDSVRIKLPPKPRPGASPVVVSAPTLQG